VSRLAVTGAAGFIGSHLVERLLADGHSVLAVDSRIGKYASPDNLAAVRDAARLTLIEADFAAPPAVEAIAACDALLHLAALPGVRAPDTPRLWDNNVTRLERLLEALRGSAVKRVVLASSSSVYGSGPGREDAPLDPLSPYARTKAAGERVCADSALETVVLRYFTVYGPRQRPDMAFARFIAAALDGRAAPLLAAGDNERHFTFVDDIVGGTVRALEAAPPGAIYNIASPHATRVSRAIELLESELDRPVPVRIEPAHPHDVPRIRAAPGAIERELGWRATTVLADGLRLQVAAALRGR
jgi:nucleoside-diphosphate-sugar epimerase